MKELAELPRGFSRPTELPSTADQHEGWQNANRTWWETHPMRYDWKDGIPYEEFSQEFFAEIDRRFFSAVELYAPCKKIPFDWLIEFDSLRTKDVLEIGVGNGSHAQLLAEHAKSFAGIDLTEYSVRSTSERLRVFGLPGTVAEMDAEKMLFPDKSFDFVWSWGVIHHSANTRKIIEEMYRVLRPGGEAVVMVSPHALGVLRARRIASGPFGSGLQAGRTSRNYPKKNRRRDGPLLYSGGVAAAGFRPVRDKRDSHLRKEN